MRAEYLNKILQPSEFISVNIDIPLAATSKILRSIGWRYRVGPLIKNINKYVVESIPNTDFDLVWIDKGVFIKPSVLQEIRNRCQTLVHFTPDPAFMYHKSRLFNESLPFYDHCITSKSFELEYYKSFGAKNILLCTQGYDPNIHRPYHSFSEKEGLVFIGHFEENRVEIIAKLLENDILIKLAGINWGKFASKHQGDKNLQYLGKGIYGEDYARLISSGYLGIGFLSKIVPELHTTRTFEIPACKTTLVTEKNKETESIFTEDEVIFYRDSKELISTVIHAFKDKGRIESTAINGYGKVTTGPYDYESILKGLLRKIYVEASEQ